MWVGGEAGTVWAPPVAPRHLLSLCRWPEADWLRPDSTHGLLPLPSACARAPQQLSAGGDGDENTLALTGSLLK